MAEKGQTSSMTSVTEEDTSADSETDTTESTYSNLTSSVLSSTDTDDKLTPGLTSISVSKPASLDGSVNKKQLLQSRAQKTLASQAGITTKSSHCKSQTKFKGAMQNICNNAASVTNNSGIEFIHPYGANPLPLKGSSLDKDQRKKKVNEYQSLFNQNQTQSFLKQRSAQYMKANLGFGYTDGSSLSTDFSDTSSRQRSDVGENNKFDKDSNDENSELSPESRESDRPFLPDLTSDRWYQAGCFDSYWSNYRFVMDWYHTHVQAIRTIHEQMVGAWGYPQMGAFSEFHGQSHTRRSHRSKKTRRTAQAKARRRKRRKEIHRSISDKKSISGNSMLMSGQDAELGSGEDDDELEMEITKDMLDFFATSYKHRLERDKEGEHGLIASAPSEQPGIRRTAEMKELYGPGAAMIQGMETAMQMTFDRFADRFQPSLWPNMPLKISFRK